MNGLQIGSLPVHMSSVVIIILNLLILTSFLFFLQSYQTAFSQAGNDLGFPTNTDNITIPNLSASNENLESSQSASGFVANGKINTVIDVPNGKWLAAGNWSIIVNNGNVTSFDTKMTWYNSSGTNAHTHDLTNFKSVSDNMQAVPMNLTDKQKTIEGFTDVGSNGRTTWFEVPTTITINDGKIISISVDDNKTNGHFAGQPLLGIVDSFVPCSDVPGPNMEFLPPCSLNTGGDDYPFMTNDTAAFPPSNQFMPEGTFPSEDPSQGFPGQGFPSEDPSQDGSSQRQSQSEDDDQTDEQFSEDDNQTGGQSSADNQTETETINPNCTELDIENVTASGFESDPSDYHPPGDAIDGDLTTWWSNNGNDPWIQISLVEPNLVCGVAVTWNKGDERDYSFQIEISEDGNSFEKVFEGANDNESTKQEIYPFDQEVNGKYIKLTITDTSSNDGWTSIQEIDALGLTEP
ncbi:MAG TPA: discoidin domain-containing protein [Nitrososphaeraceae archaeon]